MVLKKIIKIMELKRNYDAILCVRVFLQAAPKPHGATTPQTIKILAHLPHVLSIVFDSATPLPIAGGHHFAHHTQVTRTQAGTP